ncbi:MAG: tetratricopeptide repeat protein [Taibaiella sp.]|nr:tetratricopeptide repeat protein [Taibaiella sp.]
MAAAYRWAGINYITKNEFDKQLENFNHALDLYSQINDQDGIASVLGNIGISFDDQSNYPMALEYYFKALKIYEQLNDLDGIMTNLSNIGLVYESQGELQEALIFYEKALKLSEKTGNKEGISGNLNSIGSIMLRLKRYEEAFEKNEKALELNKLSGNKEWQAKNLLSMGTIVSEKQNFNQALGYFKQALRLAEEIDSKISIAEIKCNIGYTFYRMAIIGVRNPTLQILNTGRKEYLQKSREYLQSAITISERISNHEILQPSYFYMSKTEELLENLPNALYCSRKASSLNDSLFNMERDKKITQAKMQYDFDKKVAAANALQEKKDAVALKELGRQKLLRNTFIGGFSLTLLFAGVFFTQRNKIKVSKRRSDELLLNILPAEVAEELKAKGSAEAKLIDDVTVLFTDFKGFTQLSEKLSPKELVGEINTCFSGFDNIMQKYGVEKIKTIGDAYMAAGGLPTPNKTHAEDVVKAALEIQAFMRRHKEEREAAGQLYFEIRIGVHTGPVVAGIVGIKKFAYDIWGDTVNTASRMESSGSVGKVNISETTYNLVKDIFSCEYRGEVEAKGKGVMKMYFVS